MPQPTLVTPPGDRQFPSMTPSKILDEISRLSAAQQLKLVEDVWDQIAASPENVPVPEWHRAELDRRLADPGEQATLSWDDVQARLKPKP
jgi:putative addiction module component (TIGR02574 family)